MSKKENTCSCGQVHGEPSSTLTIKIDRFDVEKEVHIRTKIDGENNPLDMPDEAFEMLFHELMDELLHSLESYHVRKFTEWQKKQPPFNSRNFFNRDSNDHELL